MGLGPVYITFYTRGVHEHQAALGSSIGSGSTQS